MKSVISCTGSGRAPARPIPTYVGSVGAGRYRCAAFTLLEVLISLVLTITMLAGVFTFYMMVLKARAAGSQVSRDAQLANALLRRMADEVRHACDIVPGDGGGFSGTHDKITIVRTKMPELYAFDKHDSIADQLPPGQQDIARIGYELVWDDELTDDEGVKLCHGLLRSEQRTFDPNPKVVIKQKPDQSLGLDDTTKDSGMGDQQDGSQQDGSQQDGSQEGFDQSAIEQVLPVDRELIAPEIKYVKFEYFDGAEWKDRWQKQDAQSANSTIDPAGLMGGGEHALPQAVRITIGRDRVAPEDEELNIDQLKKMDERSKRKEFHPDRYTIVVYLEQADQSTLSSRGFSTKNDPDLQTGGQQ